MSYDRAEIERLRALRANAASSNIAAHLYLMEKDVVWARLDDCLDEIDRLASAEYEAEVVQQLRVAVDVLLTKGDRLTQCAERAEAQGRRLRESVQAIERLTRGAQGEGNHRLLVQIREAVREALAETEGR